MTANRENRRLAAILAADMAGYSRLIERDERGTISRQRAHRVELIDPYISAHNGRIVKTTGDGLLAEFASAVDAVECAVGIQTAMLDRERDIQDDIRITYRIGINIGDIVVEDDDIYGDGVNVAARLEGLASPGEIYVSRSIFDQVKNKVDILFEDLGEHQVKNISEPVQIYRVKIEELLKSTAPDGEPALEIPTKPSIAVLPFDNMSGDMEQEYFADGITEDIITALSRLRWFFVIARNSSFVYKGSAVDLRKVSRELGVRYVLEGSIRKAGNRVRISAQLIDATSGNHLWADRYDREIGDIFALQDEITQSVTAAIEPKLMAAESMRSQQRQHQDLDAWSLVGRAMARYWRMTSGDSEAAISILRSAVEKYPDYGPAHSLLAFTILVSGHVGWTPDASDYEYAATLAQRAAALDDEDPWAHLALGYLAFTERRTDDAVAQYRRALDLNPNFATAFGYLGWALAFDAQSDEAIENFQKAIRMSPHDPLKAFFFSGTGVAYYMKNDYDQAIKWSHDAIRERPGFTAARRIYCASLAQAGEVDGAARELEKLRQAQPNVSIAWCEKFVPYTDRAMPHFLEGMRKAGLS